MTRARLALTAMLGLAAAPAGCDLGHVDAPGDDTVASGPSSGCSGACHGEGDLIAPPRDTAGRTDLASIGIGAHAQHLQASDWHKRFACETCHVVPQQVGDPGHIFQIGATGTTKDPLPAEVAFGGLGTGASWDHDTATCTSSYCHGDTLHQVDPTGATAIGAGGLITQPMWTQVDGAQSKCGACHGTPPPAPHPQDSDCGLCHPSMNPGDFAAGKFSYPELHIDGLVEVSSTQPCDSCHGSGGQSAPPRDAHGNTATSARGVGAHAQHMTTASPWHAPIACNECHLVPGSTTDQTHLDGIAEVALDPTVMIPGSPLPTGGSGGKLQVQGAVWNADALTCAGTYCHGGGKSPLTGGTAISPTWTRVDGAQTQCQSCHGAPPPAPHPVDSDCGKCHPTMTAGNTTAITYPAKHIDGNVDVINDRPCDACHGAAGNAAPPADTTGGAATDLRGVGAHRSHLGASTWHSELACDDCHRVPLAMESIGHIDSALPAEIIFGNLAGGTAAWNGTTCSNVYCHGATLRSGTGPAGGTATRPVWTQVNGAQSQCGSCHGTPPPPPHPVDSDCGKCHATMTAGGGLAITDPAKHIDGNLDVTGGQACNSCHGGPGGNAPPRDSLGNTATTARGVGAHQSHLAPASLYFKPVVCTDCHRVPAALTSVGHVDTPLPAEVRFSGRAGSSPVWNGARCTNVYCHGATLTDGSGGAGGTATSPAWQTVDGSQAQCTSCHGFPPPLPHPQNADCGACHQDVRPGSNRMFLDTAKHIDGNLDVNANQACNSCHGGANNAPPRDTSNGTATSLRGVGAHQAHVATGATWHRDIACGECHVVPGTVGSVGHIDTPLPAEVAFTGVGAGGSWNGANCSSYCHGTTLRTSAGTPAGGTATTPVWTRVDGTQKQCTSCHGSPPPAPHPASNACDSCHADAGPNQTIRTPAQHIDGTVQVTAGSNHPPGYNAREMHGYDFDKRGSSTCATASCHGVALTGGNTGGPSCNNCHSANWQSDCKFCHGTTANGAPPAGVTGQTAASDPHVGAHAKHVGATAMHAAWDCTYCHTRPSTALTPGHIDGNGGIVQAEVVFSSLNPSSVFSFTATTCASSYCHGTGTGTKTSPAWTSAAPLDCVNGCHGGDPSRTGMSSGHRRGDHKRSCVTCHKSVVSSSNQIVNVALHVNGAKDVQFGPAGSSYNAANKSCTGTGGGCHGSGTQRGW